MNKMITTGLVLGALALGMLPAPVLASVDSDLAQCREQAYAMWQRGRTGDGLDRQREFIANSCMASHAH